MITVYSKPACMQCSMTVTTLERAGLPHQVIDVTENAAALAYVTEELGYSAAPIVVVDDHNHWGGFPPDLIAVIKRGQRG